ncbi:unnamed protein product, partial [marine sediment metagenome]
HILIILLNINYNIYTKDVINAPKYLTTALNLFHNSKWRPSINNKFLYIQRLTIRTIHIIARYKEIINEKFVTYKFSNSYICNLPDEILQLIYMFICFLPHEIKDSVIEYYHYN